MAWGWTEGVGGGILERDDTGARCRRGLTMNWRMLFVFCSVLVSSHLFTWACAVVVSFSLADVFADKKYVIYLSGSHIKGGLRQDNCLLTWFLLGEGDPGVKATDWPEFQKEKRYDGMAEGIVRNAGKSVRPLSLALAVGFPFRTVFLTASEYSQKPRWVSVDTGWGWVFANSLLWTASLCFFVWAGRYVRGVSRRRRGLCANCGYPRVPVGTCPECGKCYSPSRP